MADLNLVRLLEQGGFAAAFFWILIDTRRDRDRRDQEAAKREERLHELLRAYADQLTRVQVDHARQFAEQGEQLAEQGRQLAVLTETQREILRRLDLLGLPDERVRAEDNSRERGKEMDR